MTSRGLTRWMRALRMPLDRASTLPGRYLTRASVSVRSAGRRRPSRYRTRWSHASRTPQSRYYASTPQRLISRTSMRYSETRLRVPGRRETLEVQAYRRRSEVVRSLA
jgi:hypothetical protein